MLFLRKVNGISTAGRSMRLALRSRVNMSAIGSVIMAAKSSPTCFLNAWNHAIAGQLAEADSTNAELAIHRSRPAAQSATEPNANLVARAHLVLNGVFFVRIETGQIPAKLDHLGFGGHRVVSLPCRR